MEFPLCESTDGVFIPLQSSVAVVHWLAVQVSSASVVVGLWYTALHPTAHHVLTSFPLGTSLPGPVAFSSTLLYRVRRVQ